MQRILRPIQKHSLPLRVLVNVKESEYLISLVHLFAISNELSDGHDLWYESLIYFIGILLRLFTRACVCKEHAVHVLSQETRSVIAKHHSIRINHRYYLEDELRPELLGETVLLKKGWDKAMHDPGRVRLSWVHSAVYHNDFLLVKFPVLKVSNGNQRYGQPRERFAKRSWVKHSIFIAVQVLLDIFVTINIFLQLRVCVRQGVSEVHLVRQVVELIGKAELVVALPSPLRSSKFGQRVLHIRHSILRPLWMHILGLCTFTLCFWFDNWLLIYLIKWRSLVHVENIELESHPLFLSPLQRDLALHTLRCLRGCLLFEVFMIVGHLEIKPVTVTLRIRVCSKVQIVVEIIEFYHSIKIASFKEWIENQRSLLDIQVILHHRLKLEYLRLLQILVLREIEGVELLPEALMNFKRVSGSKALVDYHLGETRY